MTLQVRTSERRCYKRCPQQWWWTYVEGLKALRAANPLWFGQAIHVALAEWYRPGLERGPHPVETFKKALEGDRLVRVTNEEEEREFVDARELGVEMLMNYIKEYGNDEQWFVIATEQQFSVWLSSFTGKKRHLNYIGTLDGVFRYLPTGEIRMMEHKTAASIILTHLPLDDQAGSYWAFARSILRKLGGELGIRDGEDIAAIEYNFLRKAKADTRPVNERGQRCNKPTKQHFLDAFASIGMQGSDLSKLKVVELETLARDKNLVVFGDESKLQPPPLFERPLVRRDPQERKVQIRRIKVEGWYMEETRNGSLPLFKNPTKDCSWDCPFHQMCQLHEQGADADVDDFKEAMFRIGDPYMNEEFENIKTA